jgi:glycosyltransferase involved in cell wall biosynthesis
MQKDERNGELLLSILTPTLVERRERFRYLEEKLRRQIQNGFFTDRVEHLRLEDNRERFIGHKRNILMDRAKGDFIVFVDDDDDLSDDYVSLICETLEANPDIDCVGIRGTITFEGSRPHDLFHSIQYRRYFKKNGIYYRPAMHFNPIRREIAVQYRFEEVNFHEDIDWGMRMVRDNVLKKECLISRPVLFYNSRRKWWYQVLIDYTEDIRRVLGIQWVNCIRLRRWMREHF